MEKKLEEYLMNQKQELEKLDTCLYEHKNSTERGRVYHYQRDYARVLYSNSFRRLQGKMQLMEVNSQVFYRNRLTHSFEVAQIARSIAEQLSEKCKDLYDQNSIYVIEAGALAHDIGNPPFGHHGERVLNKLSDLPFEGNAQGIRVLRSVEKKDPNYPGLNLSYRTLASIVKYNVPYKNVQTEKFLYKEDFDFFENKLKECTLRTLDVQIIDLADEIAYCSHDLEDSMAMNFFTIDEFYHDLKQKLDDKLFEKFENWVDQAKTYAEKTKTQDDYSYYFRRELLSIIVNNLIDDIGVIKIDNDFKCLTGTNQEKELGFVELSDLVKAMKKMTFKGVTQSNSIMLYEKLGTNVLSGLFEVYTDRKYNKNGVLLPIEYRWTEKDSIEYIHRNVLDYLSGMMDDYAIMQYELYFGHSKVDNLYQPKLFDSKLENKKKFKFCKLFS